MCKNLLDKPLQDFINQNLGKDISALALQTNPFPAIDWKDIVQQIQSKQKCRAKLPTWFNTPNILYPPKISVEQSSSEILAKHKSSSVSGKNLIDLTGGFGVDTYYFSREFEQVIHAEIDADLCQIVTHNSHQLNADNLRVYHGDGRKILQNIDQKFDWIYIDPARRDNLKRKVFRLSDCTPDVTILLDEYFRFTEQILIKTAPLLDISQGINELKFVEKIEIISLNNEVKELLWFLRKNYVGEPSLFVVDYGSDGTKKTLQTPLNDIESLHYQSPKNFLYEPIPALMKSGCFNFIATHFGLQKIDLNSHLYTSDTLKDFWGRRFKINSVEVFSKATMKSWTNKKAHISCRNFPMKPEEIRKKFKIKDGGENYLFFTSIENGKKKLVISCEKA